MPRLGFTESATEDKERFSFDMFRPPEAFGGYLWLHVKGNRFSALFMGKKNRKKRLAQTSLDLGANASRAGEAVPVQELDRPWDGTARSPSVGVAWTTPPETRAAVTHTYGGAMSHKPTISKDEQGTTGGDVEWSNESTITSTPENPTFDPVAQAVTGEDKSESEFSTSARLDVKSYTAGKVSSISTISDEGRDYAVEPIGARIKVIGIGGGGSNAVNNMIRSGLKGVEFITANTDIQSLRSSLSEIKVQLGKNCTKGLGAGANPEMGESGARESADEIREVLSGADMVFITAGLGGGTGTGAASVVAQIAKELGALTVGVVTKPFLFEGKRRMSNADLGMQNLKREVDTLITIPNQRLLSIAGRNTTLLDCFRRADDVLFQAVKGISDLILFEGLVNVDFADVKAVMSEMGMAMMGSGEGEGENRAVEAAEKAISSPLLEDISIHGARGILINVTAGQDVTLQEINEAAELIHQEAHEDANIIWGMVIDPDMKDMVRVTVIATGFGDEDRRMVSVPSSAMSTGPQLDASGYDKKLDIPTFSRNKLKEPTAPAATDTLKLKKVSVAPVSEEEDKYEIPTFLRRQVD